MESRPAKARYTTGKSRSTPASTNCVLMTLTDSLWPNLPFIVAMTSLRCCPHMRADKWMVPSGIKAWSSRQLLRSETTHRTWSHFIREDATSGQSETVRRQAGRCTLTRRSDRCRASTVSPIISCTFRSPLKACPSIAPSPKAGWVAVEITRLTW